MTTCRITDLIPFIDLKKINIYDEVGNLAQEDNSAFRDPHLAPDPNLNNNIQDSLTLDFHICLEDIIFNPNVESSGELNIIGSTTQTMSDMVEKYWASLNDDVSTPENPIDTSNYNTQLPEDVVGSIIDSDLSFTEYLMNRDFTDHFKVQAFYIKNPQVIKLLKEIDRRYDLQNRRDMGWKIRKLLESVLSGYDRVKPPLKYDNNNLIIGFDLPTINLGWMPGKIVDFLTNSVDIDDSSLMEWIMKNNIRLPGTTPSAPNPFLSTGIYQYDIRFGQKKLKDLIASSAGTFDENGNLKYSVLPDSATTLSANHLPGTIATDRGKFFRITDSVDVQNAAIFLIPIVDPQILDIGVGASWGNYSEFYPNGTNTDFDNYLKNLKARSNLFIGRGRFVNILESNKSIYMPRGDAGGNSIIQDFREIQRLKSFNYDSYSNEYKFMMDTLADKINKTTEQIDANFTSGLYSSFYEGMHSNTKVNHFHVINYFSFNMFGYLRYKSVMSNLYDRLAERIPTGPFGGSVSPGSFRPVLIMGTLLMNTKVTNMRIYRERVDNSYLPSTAIEYYGRERFANNQRRQLICHSSDRDFIDFDTARLKPMRFNDTENGNALSSIQQIMLRGAMDEENSDRFTFRTYCFTDKDVVKKKTGKYQYSVEIDIHDHIFDYIAEKFIKLENMVVAYDNLISYLNYGHAINPSPMSTQYPTNYFYLTNEINPSLYTSAGNPIAEFQQLIDEILAYKDHFYDLFLLFAGVNLDSEDFGPQSMLRNLKFVDLLEIEMVRDFLNTFAQKVSGIMNNKGIGRPKPKMTNNGHSTYSSNEGVFSRPKFSTYSYKFKDVVDINKTQDLMYEIIGSKLTHRTIQPLNSPDRNYVAIKQSNIEHGSCNYVRMAHLIERLRREWQNINNDYTTPLQNIPSSPQASTGVGAYTALAPYQIVQPVGWTDNYMFAVSSTYANRGTDSRTVYMTDVNKSLLGIVNSYGDSQDYHEDAVELSDMVLASMTNYGNAQHDYTSNYNAVFLSNNPDTTVNINSKMQYRKNDVYEKNRFKTLMQNACAGTVECLDSKITVTDFDDGITDSKVTCDLEGVFESRTYEQLESFIPFGSDELIDSKELLDPDSALNSRPNNQNGNTSANSTMDNYDCSTITDFVTSRIMTNTDGYDILSREQLVQGGSPSAGFVYEKFSDKLNTIITQIQNNMGNTGGFADWKNTNYIPQQAFLKDFSDRLDSKILFPYQLYMMIETLRNYQIQVLQKHDNIDMTPVWKTFSLLDITDIFNSLEIPFLLCRLKLNNKTDMGINNINILNYEIYNRHFLLLSPNINMPPTIAFGDGSINVVKAPTGGGL